jgi:SAM-dependent methyltransferase
MRLDHHYWNKRYKESQTGWDIGGPSPPLMHFIRSKLKTDDRILIPGGGNAWDAIEAFREGYKRVYVIDWAPEVRNAFLQRYPEFPADQYICEDFFDHESEYDAILEQTFFCALHPSLRGAYAQKMFDLLRKGGCLAGVLFAEEMPDGPPFGGRKEEYEKLFRKLFDVQKMELCYNSIAPRAGRELFLWLRKPSDNH